MLGGGRFEALSLAPRRALAGQPLCTTRLYTPRACRRGPQRGGPPRVYGPRSAIPAPIRGSLNGRPRAQRASKMVPPGSATPSGVGTTRGAVHTRHAANRGRTGGYCKRAGRTPTSCRSWSSRRCTRPRPTTSRYRPSLDKRAPAEVPESATDSVNAAFAIASRLRLGAACRWNR